MFKTMIDVMVRVITMIRVCVGGGGGGGVQSSQLCAVRTQITSTFRPLMVIKLTLHTSLASMRGGGGGGGGKGVFHNLEYVNQVMRVAC